MRARYKQLIQRVFTPEIIFVLLLYIIAMIIIIAIWQEYIVRLDVLQNITVQSVAKAAPK
jgi:hypothetical protein